MKNVFILMLNEISVSEFLFEYSDMTDIGVFLKILWIYSM
jgi:hypothetical protein